MRKIAAKLAAHSDLVADAYIRKRYTILFYSLLLTLVASPLLAALQWKSTFIETLLAVTLLIAVIPVRSRQRAVDALDSDCAGLGRPVFLCTPRLSVLTA